MSARTPVRNAVALAVVVCIAAGGAARASELEDRVTRIETVMQSQGLIDMLSQLQQLQREVQELRGAVDMQGEQLRQMQEQQRTLYLDIDRRLQAGGAVPGSAAGNATGNAIGGGLAGSPSGAPAALAVNGAPPPGTPPSTVAPGAAIGTAAPGMVTPGTPTPITGAPVTPSVVAPVTAAPVPMPQATVASPDEQAAYEQALNILREGRYADAAQAYRQFLANYPHGRYVDNAQYWLAETQYVTRQFPQALEEFGKVVNGYPNSAKAPDALLKMGYIHYEQGDWKAARENLQGVTQRFPDSTAARLASERLQRMDREGR